MKMTTIQSFTDRHAVTVYGKQDPTLGDLVYLTQHADGLGFVFPMKPEQARALAAALVAEADALEKVTETQA